MHALLPRAPYSMAAVNRQIEAVPIHNRLATLATKPPPTSSAGDTQGWNRTAQRNAAAGAKMPRNSQAVGISVNAPLRRSDTNRLILAPSAPDYPISGNPRAKGSCAIGVIRGHGPRSRSGKGVQNGPRMSCDRRAVDRRVERQTRWRRAQRFPACGVAWGIGERP